MSLSAPMPEKGMAPEPPWPHDQHLAELLRTNLGQHLITSWEVFEPWSVARLHLEGADRTSVILKWLRRHGGTGRIDPDQVLTEYVALRFLGELGLCLTPAVLGADLSAGLLIMEDLAPRRPLLDLLVDQDPMAPRALNHFAASMAALHSGTVGQAGPYYEARARLGPVDPSTELRRFFSPLANLSDLEEVLDAVVTPAVDSDLEAMKAELSEPGAFLALSNGDMGTNNFLVGEREDGRFIDFEFAGYRHCLADVACLYVPGPQWMKVGQPLEDGTEIAYRSHLVDAIPEVGDDHRYGLGLTAAGVAYVLMRLNRFELLDQRPFGHESRRQMVSTLSAAHALVQRFGVLGALGDWMQRAESGLRRIWPDADVDLEEVAPYSRRI